jgi:hypothetical protein
VRLSLTDRRFTVATFEAVVREACHIPEDARLADQVRYLAEYLAHAEMGAKALFIEHPYIDRHFLTEYQGYYATALRDTPRFTTRIHAFSADLSVQRLVERLAATTSKADRELVQADIQQAYLGFVVLRPLAASPIGRTVLSWYEGRHARCFGPEPPLQRVHLLGLTLNARGVQFHQQDPAVGACATAAVWSALAAVMRRDGGRSPTPLEVTEWATRSLPTTRAFPAVSGLTLEQMIAAINASGYSPDVIKPEGHPALFRLQLMTYVRSGIPVVLQVREEGATEGHAITMVGFRVSDDQYDAPAIRYPFKESLALRAKGMTRVYVHDDRLGPYARMTWIPEQEPASYHESPAEDAPANEDQEGAAPSTPLSSLPSLRFDGAGFEGFNRAVRVWNAIAPLYPKIRINALDLHSVAAELWPMVRFMAGPERRDQLLLETCFSLGGSYLSSLYEGGLTPARAAEIARTVLLSRYVGVLRFCVDDEWLLDAVCDATDIHRDQPAWGSVLALIPASDSSLEDLRERLREQFPHVTVA